MCRNPQEIVATGNGLLFLRDAADRPDSVTRPDVRKNRDREEKKKQVLLCRQCDTQITKDNFRISRNEKHLHTFFNPAGIVYEIACFRDAPGCLVRGVSSDEFSWFAGYSWQISVCISCLAHLGWHFSGGDDAFFGLIANRLKEGTT